MAVGKNKGGGRSGSGIVATRRNRKMCPLCGSAVLAARAVLRCTQSGCAFTESDWKPSKAPGTKPLSKEQRSTVAATIRQG